MPKSPCVVPNLVCPDCGWTPRIENGLIAFAECYKAKYDKSFKCPLENKVFVAPSDLVFSTLIELSPSDVTLEQFQDEVREIDRVRALGRARSKE